MRSGQVMLRFWGYYISARCVMCRQVPPAYLIQGRPLELEGEVVAGFGRGSSKMGVPTANIAPGPLAAKLEGLPLGVYFG